MTDTDSVSCAVRAEYLNMIGISNLMFEQCIIRRSRNNQHNTQISSTALFVYIGSYMYRQ
jgi:hypothetical protein